MIAELIGYSIGNAFVEAELCSTPEAAFRSLPVDSEERKNLIQNNPKDDLHEKAKLLIRINKLMENIVKLTKIISTQARNRRAGNPRARRTPRANLTRNRRCGGKAPGRTPGTTPISEAELNALQKEIDSLIITADATES